MGETKSDILQGTLDLMVLQTLDAMGPLHGYGIARRIEQISEDVLQLNQGTIYASLLRLQQRRWISASWGTSDNNRQGQVLRHHQGRAEAARRRGARTGSASPASSAGCCGWRGTLTPCGPGSPSSRRALRGLFAARRLDDDFDAEIDVHLEMLTDEHIRRGMPPDEARARRRSLRFGGAVQIKEQQRDDRGLPFVETTLQDVRYAPARAAQEPGATRRSRLRRSRSASAPAPRSSASSARCCCVRCPTRARPAGPRSSRPTRSGAGRGTSPRPPTTPTGSAQNKSFTDIAAYEQFSTNGSGASDMFLTGFGEPQG